MKHRRNGTHAPEVKWCGSRVPRQTLNDIRAQLKPIRKDLYGGHATAHPLIVDTPESLHRLREDLFAERKGLANLIAVRDNVRMMHILYGNLHGDLEELIGRTTRKNAESNGDD